MSDFTQRIRTLTPAQRELLLRRIGLAGKTARAADIPRRPSGDAPLSFAQQRLWFLDQLQGSNAAYVIPLGLELQGALDVDTLGRSLDAIVMRHEVLRTTFPVIDGVPRQVVAQAGGWPLSLADLRSLPEAKRQVELRRIVADQQRPFSFADGPLLRACLARLEEHRHVLLLALHHIIADGWSLGILLRELASYYTAIRGGGQPDLAPLAVQYGDFACWQQSRWQSGLLEPHLDAWRRRLAGLSPLELPSDRPRPSVQSLSGATCSRSLDDGLAQALRRQHRQGESTLFMTLLSAFQYVLSRYAGQSDIAVGSPVAGRNVTQLEAMIGCFMNMLVLRTDVGGEPSFRQLLAMVRETALDAYAHQEVPFEKLVEILRPQRDLARSPLVSVTFAVQNTPPATVEMLGVTAKVWPVEVASARFDLEVNAWDLPAGIQLVATYNSDLYDGRTVARLLEHTEALLAAAMADPERPLSTLPLLGPAERRQVLHDWNDTAAAFSQHASLWDLFVQQVQRSPAEVAVCCGGVEMTWGELCDRSERLAAKLAAAGVGPGRFVGICMQRGVEMVVGLLAILRAGGAYVPIDEDLPAKRLDFMAADLGMALVLTQKDRSARFDRQGLKTVLVEDAEAADVCPDEVNRRPAPEWPAYVMYTSGSTGEPKGVVVRHRAVVNFLEAMRHQPGIDQNDVLLAITPLSFDISVLEIFLPLVSGARLAIAQDPTRRDPRAIASQLADCGATILQATPTTWRMLVASDWAGSKSLTALCGGEALPRDLADLLLQRCQTVWNLYGPTEATVWATAERVSPGNVAVSIGRPIRNLQVYLLDHHHQPVPVGLTGEVYLGGEGLACGYFGRAAWTAEKFIPSPFARRPGERLFRTGDFARYLPCGRLQLVGRRDDQVKLRGVRVELGEIETVLRRHPAVRNAAVLARHDSRGETQLVGYIVRHAGHAAGAAELRALLADHLPANIGLSALVFLDEFPLTAGGKIDRRALPPPDQRRPDLATTHVAPRNPLEETIATIWRRLLPVTEIGVDDNFFDLGGHSMLLVEMRQVLEATLAVSISVADLFRYPTVAALASFIANSNPPSSPAAKADQRAAAQRRAASQRARRKPGDPQ